MTGLNRIGPLVPGKDRCVNEMDRVRKKLTRKRKHVGQDGTRNLPRPFGDALAGPLQIAICSTFWDTSFGGHRSNLMSDAAVKWICFPHPHDSLAHTSNSFVQGDMHSSDLWFSQFYEELLIH